MPVHYERAELPDIDVDFDSRRRDEVAAYVFQKYGAEHVAAVCTYQTYHARSALRDLGKAMGIPAEDLDRLAKRIPYYHARDLRTALAEAPELRALRLPAHRWEGLIGACEAVAGFPRHMGTHLGGLVISREPLTAITPLQHSAKGVVVCQFDKEFVEDLGLLKLDLLSLRTLGAVDEAVAAVREEGGRLDFDRLPRDDRATYARLRRGETIGVFQLESPAQRALQGQLGADRLEDLIASVALIRPGPIQGDMVGPFLRRRRGEEAVSYLHPSLEPILKKTYGVVLYQEQVIEIAVHVGGFTPGEADALRRAMSHARRREDMDGLGRLFVEKAGARGIPGETARAIFQMMAGYASYGFCEAHAAAFGDTAYRTAYLLEHHPAEYYAALLSLQPMGYYPPNTLCGEARRRGIAILPPHINRSGRNFAVEALEGRQGLRIPLARVELSAPSLEAILAAREAAGPFASAADLVGRVRLPRDELERLILAGALDPLEQNRRALLWRLDGLLAAARCGAGSRAGARGESLLAAAAPGAPGADADMADFTDMEKRLWEYRLLGIMVRGHLMACWRRPLAAAGFLTTARVRALRDGAPARLAGLLVRPHRPPTKSGRVVVFLSLEDEAGLADVTVFEDLYQRTGHFIFGGETPLLQVAGTVRRRGRSVSLVAHHLAPFSPRVIKFSVGNDDI